MSAFDRKTKEKAFFLGIGALTILIFIPLFHIIATVLIKGFPVIAERGGRSS